MPKFYNFPDASTQFEALQQPPDAIQRWQQLGASELKVDRSPPVAAFASALSVPATSFPAQNYETNIAGSPRELLSGSSTGEASDLRQQPTGEASHLRQEPTGEASHLRQEPTGEAYHLRQQQSHFSSSSPELASLGLISNTRVDSYAVAPTRACFPCVKAPEIVTDTLDLPPADRSLQAQVSFNMDFFSCGC